MLKYVQARNSEGQLWETERDIIAEIEDFQKRKEIHWQQRSRVKWLKAGDKNSKFFHSSTIHRRQVNIITRLNTNRGWLTDDSAIISHINGFFEQIFFKSN